jgi:hypothetical protein
MSAFTSTDDRHRALRLIGYRALDVVTINGGAAGFLQLTEPEQLPGLLHGVLELFASVRLRLRPDLLTAGLGDLALTQIAEIDQSTDRRLGAELIIAHAESADTYGENVLRDHGADDFDRGIDQMDGRYHEIILAITDVWLELLPELRTEDGMELLVKHAAELD